MRIEKLDMSRVDGYSMSEFEVVVEALKNREIYRHRLVYRGINGEFSDNVLKTGLDIAGDIMSGSSEEEILGLSSSSGMENPFEYVSDFENKGLSVYDQNLLNWKSPSEYEFKFPNKKLEALVAVFKLIY